MKKFLKGQIGFMCKNKNDFRKKCKEKLRKTANKNKIKRDVLVGKKLLEYIEKTGAKNLLLYMPLKEEVDIIKVMQKLRKNDKYTIFVPFMEGVSFKMVKFRLPLYIKKFDIREPKNSFALSRRIDLAIVPTLGVDGAFRRIGFGKGMYDRFFQSLPYRPKIAFVELDDCFTTSHVGESHDIQADIYITPYKTRKRGQR